MREIYIDNRYSSPTLFVLRREKYGILACGTIRSNRKGWDSNVMNLKKSAPRGTSLVKYDPTNKVLFGQWKDNKVVSFISRLGIFGMVTIQSRVGLEKTDFQIPAALKKYTSDNFMGGVDNMHKDKSIGGGFTRRAMFRKWYRMGLMGVFDFMVVNGRQAWNMTATNEENDRFHLNNAMFRMVLVEELLAFRDESAVNFASEEKLWQSMIMLESVHGMVTIPRTGRITCCVC